MFITGRLIFSSVFEIIPRDTNKKHRKLCQRDGNHLSITNHVYIQVFQLQDSCYRILLLFLLLCVITDLAEESDMLYNFNGKTK